MYTTDDRRRSTSRLVFLAALALLATALFPSQVVLAHAAASPTLYVYFGYNSDITLKLADGTPVGSVGGSPTVIAAGYYTLSLEQPGCVQVPAFELQGPGVSLVDNLSGGEVTSATVPVDLQPNATYTWQNASNQSVKYTFATSSVILGSPPSADQQTGSSPAQLGKTPTVNSSVIGSEVAKVRGTIVGKVSASGRLTLSHGGKSVGTLPAGLYRFAVTDRSRSNSFLLASASGRRTIAVTGATFTGTHSTVVDLTTGRWRFMPRQGIVSFVVTVTSA
jgi:hypothetical protein